LSKEEIAELERFSPFLTIDDVNPANRVIGAGGIKEFAQQAIPKAYGLEAATLKYARESPQSCRALRLFGLGGVVEVRVGFGYYPV